MSLGFRPVFTIFFSCIALPALPHTLFSQESGSSPVATAEDIPKAPLPQFSVSTVEPPDQQNPAQPASPQQAPAPPTQPPPPDPTSPAAQTPAAQGSSSSQSSVPQTEAEKSQREKAAEQLKAQEKQRVMGVMATFNTTTNRNALPLSPGQKFQLFFKSATDPWPFLLAGVVAGIGQANNTYPEWGQGAQGYAKRFGASYSDAFIGNFFGNAVLPVVLHEDPRYFQMGTGRVAKRFLWAAASSFWCRRDNGKWGPNYANVMGNLIGAAIARAYYPASERTVSDTIDDGLTVSVEGIVGAEVIEFWPDLVRHHKRKQAEKLARQAAKTDAQGAAQAPAKDATEKTAASPN